MAISGNYQLSNSTRPVLLAIAFEGSSQLWKDATICRIDLIKLKDKDGVFADSDKKGDSSLQEGRLIWHIPETDSKLPWKTEKKTALLAVSPELAANIELTARVFVSYLDLSRLTKGFDGSIKPEQSFQRQDIPIHIEARPKMENGQSYMIQVTNAGNKQVTAKFHQVQGSEILTQKPSAVEEIRLTPPQLEVYQEAAACVLQLDLYIEKFAKQAHLSYSPNYSLPFLSLPHEKAAAEILKQYIQQMKEETLTGHLALIKDYYRGACPFKTFSKARFEALGGLGAFSAIMRKCLEVFAQDKKDMHQELIEKISSEYAAFQCSVS